MRTGQYGGQERFTRTGQYGGQEYEGVATGRIKIEKNAAGCISGGILCG